MRSNWNAALCAVLSLGIGAAGFAYGQEADASLRGVSLPGAATEQTPGVVPTRIVQPVNDSRLVRLTGNTHPLARAEFDRGPVDPQLPMERMLMLLKRSPEQDEALNAFMARQQDPGSADYHHWLEPEEFGRLYGPSDADIASVTNWLKNQGFSVDKVANGRMFLEFSGTAGLVSKAFHTEIHNYNVRGVDHIANNHDPSIPEALSPVISGIVSLHNFFLRPQHVDLGAFRHDKKTGKWLPEGENVGAKPLFNTPSADNGFELVSPFDFAAIYNVQPLWTAGTDGTGQTVAIAGRSDISLTDVANFRKTFGLPVKAPTIIVNGPDPGIPSADDKVENTLDVEWSGAVAKGATIKFVTTASTSTSDGAVVSALFIIDNKTAPIMSFSYGSCELEVGTTGNAADNTMWQQGASEGISEFVASGDQGSAACDGGQAAPYAAQFGLAVSATSTTPWDVAVGGTDLNWANNTGTTYWSSTNATDGQSALGYIPEVPWNGSCASTDVDLLIGATALGWDAETTCEQILAQSVDTFLLNVTGGTGGKSACTTNNTTSSSTTLDPASCSGGYAKPSWQTGTGVPADGKRDVPDLSLFASSGALNTAYAICDSDSAPCTYTDANDALAQAVGGTSVASPAMAGIMALVLQHVGGAAQGLPNKTFYALAAKDTLSACNSNTVAGGNTCNFFDVTSDNIAVPCQKGTPNCTIHDSGDTIGIIDGYNAGTGYDLATGLGSVNANNLVKNWPSSAPTITATLTPNPLNFPATVELGTSAALTATLKNTGTGTMTITSGGITFTGTNPLSFIETTTCGSTLAAGASCAINVKFNPQKTGALTATLNVADNATGSPQTITVNGTGTAPSTGITLTPTSIAFPTTGVGNTSVATPVTVKNGGTTAVTLTSFTFVGTNPLSFVELNTCGTSLAGGASCTVFVAFKPTKAGALTATLDVANSAAGSPKTVTLTGTGAALDTVTLSATTLAFGSVAKGTTSVAKSVTVTNGGTSTLDITGISITGLTATSFSELSTCGPTLAPAASCLIEVVFKPASAATFSDTLSVADNGSGTPQKVTLTGTGH
jgi:hypothetical protein